MERILFDIVDTLRAHPDVARLDDRAIQAIVRAYNSGLEHNKDHFAKKQILPFYLSIKANDPARWASWGIDGALEKRLLATLQVKPRRTASGVATITVITKPAPCGSACLYCPNDVRMPKSYLRDEPACQRAERNFFDPYLQVVSRARALHEMGHNISKIEIIVLGGTWCDYPEDYQRWFATELFRAANNLPAELAEAERHARFFNAIDAGVSAANADEPEANAAKASMTNVNEPEASTAKASAANVDAPEASTANSDAHANDDPTNLAGAHNAQARRAFYEQCGLTSNPEELEAQTKDLQDKVMRGEATYNQVATMLYGESAPWRNAAALQAATPDDLEREHTVNATSAHRIVGFVVETRPDTITPARLALLRSFGCTKVQMGIQSLDPKVLQANNRPTAPEKIQRALALARLFGFKLHTHFMVNLAAATPDSDKAEYKTFVTDPAYLPDEVKLYPCALVGGTGLVDLYERGDWRPYAENELLDVLVADVLETPDYCRISRMIRDISAGDILVGNKKTNLRQMVEQRLDKLCKEGNGDDGNKGDNGDKEINTPTVREIRYREISTQTIDLDTLALRDTTYETAVSTEHFLQWVTPEGLIAGFLRLSLPHANELAALNAALKNAASAADRPTTLNAALGEADAIAAPNNSANAASDNPAAATSADATTAADNPAARAAAAIAPGAAMIREVHVYGRAANLGASVDGAQHTGLGRQLIARAETIAREAGYAALNVISSVGTREYYRNLGFEEVGLYQQKPL